MQLTAKSFFGGAVALPLAAAVLALSLPLIGGLFTGNPAPDHGAPSSPVIEPSAAPAEPEILTCEDSLSAHETPTVYTANQRGWRENLDAGDLSINASETDANYSAHGERSIQLVARYSTHFDELGCADDGSAWLVIQLRDEAEFKFVAGMQYSYTTSIDAATSSYRIEFDGAEYEAAEVLQNDDGSGQRVVVFEVPSSEYPAFEFKGVLAYSASIHEYKTFDAEMVPFIPSTITYEFEMNETIRIDREFGGCNAFENGWC